MLTAVGVFLTAVVKKMWMPWVLSFFISISIAVAYSVILTIFSNQVDESEQGWVMGVTGSIMALSFGLNALLTGVIASHIYLPIALSALGLALAGILMIFYKERGKSNIKPLTIH